MLFTKTRFTGAVLLAQICCTGTAFAQSGSSVSIIPRVRTEPVANYAVYPHADLRIDVPLILTPVHVTTVAGTSVTDLRKENFRIFEDGVEQRVTNFAFEDAPISVGMLFDSSGSMHTKIHKSAEAAEAFFKVANPEDEFFLVEFNDRPRLTVPFTRDSDQIYQRIEHVRAMGRTSLLDAIHLALAQMKHAHNPRKALVIFSDGGDNRSRYSEREIKKAMLESDVEVFAMGIFDEEESRKLSREEQNGPQLLTELAEETGGKHFPVEHLNDLPTVCDHIGNELRSQYLLGYLSTNGARDGRYRRIKVLLNNTGSRPQLKPYYRQGYYAPLQ